MRLWGATPWRSRRAPVATAPGRICVWASRAAAFASASLLLACLTAAVRAEPPPGLKRSDPEGPAPSEGAPPKVAQQPAPSWTTQRIASRLKHNQDALIVATSRPDTPYLVMAGDLVSAVGPDNNFRILPIAAEGGLANLQDLLLLRGVDLAIVPANVLAYAKATNALGGSLPQRLAYLAPLYGEEVHVIVGPEIASAADLRGRKIAIPPGDGTVQFTAKDILEHLGVTFEEVSMEPADAVRGVRSGTVAAALLVAGKPVPLVSALPKDGRLRLLSLSFPKPPGEGEGYAPAVLLPDDYPALIPPGAIVETVAVGAVLMASKEVDEARRIARHAPALLDAIARLAVSQRHPKWKDVNLGATLPGWSRVPAAEAWLARAAAQRREALQSQFEEFLRAEKRVSFSELSDPQKKKKLFDEFQAWARKSVTSERAAK